jgi:hypothetical protein
LESAPQPFSSARSRADRARPRPAELFGSAQCFLDRYSNETAERGASRLTQPFHSFSFPFLSFLFFSYELGFEVENLPQRLMGLQWWAEAHITAYGFSVEPDF